MYNQHFSHVESFFYFSVNLQYLSVPYVQHATTKCWMLDLQLPMQSVPITTNVVRILLMARCTRYNFMR